MTLEMANACQFAVFSLQTDTRHPPPPSPHPPPLHTRHTPRRRAHTAKLQVDLHGQLHTDLTGLVAGLAGAGCVAIGG